MSLYNHHLCFSLQRHQISSRSFFWLEIVNVRSTIKLASDYWSCFWFFSPFELGRTTNLSQLQPRSVTKTTKQFWEILHIHTLSWLESLWLFLFYKYSLEESRVILRKKKTRIQSNYPGKNHFPWQKNRLVICAARHIAFSLWFYVAFFYFIEMIHWNSIR